MLRTAAPIDLAAVDSSDPVYLRIRRWLSIDRAEAHLARIGVQFPDRSHVLWQNHGKIPHADNQWVEVHLKVEDLILAEDRCMSWIEWDLVQVPPLGSSSEGGTSHGASWRVARDTETGFASMIYGGPAPAFARPQSDSDWVTTAQVHVSTTRGMHGIDEGTLEPDVRPVRFLPLGRMPRGQDKVAVRMRQRAADVPVDDGFVSVLMATDGTLLAVQSTASPFLEELELVAKVSAFEAEQVALLRFVEQVGLGPSEDPESPRIVVIQAVREGKRRPRLAWVQDMWWSDVGLRPEAWRYWVDALDGSILRQKSLVSSFDVGGTPCTWATEGVLPDGESPEIKMDMPYARVTGTDELLIERTVYTDRLDNWIVPGATALTSVRFEYLGLHVNVDYDAGDDYYREDPLLTGTSNEIVMNEPANDEYRTAQANAYIVINKVGDYIRDTACDEGEDCDPTKPDESIVVSTNEIIGCGPYYDGAEIHLNRATANCWNGSFSTIVAHEYGHELVERYGTGGGDIREGTADIWAMFVYDTELIGAQFSHSSEFSRTGLNTRQFCGDLFPNCHQEIHSSGEVWMGAAWKVRVALNAAHGDDIGDAIADTVFVSWMNAFTQSKLSGELQLQWLCLDDDDSDFDNGTPNICQISIGFRAQGFPEVCLPGTCSP